jgi:hypothetical protein
MDNKKKLKIITLYGMNKNIFTDTANFSQDDKARYTFINTYIISTYDETAINNKFNYVLHEVLFNFDKQYIDKIKYNI